MLWFVFITANNIIYFALGSTAINHWASYKAVHFLKMNFHFTLFKKNSTPLGSFCLPRIAQGRPNTRLCFLLPLTQQSY